VKGKAWGCQVMRTVRSEPFLDAFVGLHFFSIRFTLIEQREMSPKSIKCLKNKLNLHIQIKKKLYFFN
jgi:hypothetical protein